MEYESVNAAKAGSRRANAKRLFLRRELFHMTVAQVADILDAKVVAGDDLLDRDVHTVCGSDLMSDVLAFVKDQAVLITGLTNAQAVRTAEMMDIKCVVLVRGKTADAGMVALARDCTVTVLETDHSMFTACGLLYENGLRGGGDGKDARRFKAAL